ncbi:transglutaminase family protein [Pararobbsia silviterrae]|uniref:Transglutaminase family protein n=1 Tax=Pararobbsia silviterrae TaxID=1792498 RepID=A0A494XW30_9BURK|nr:transglutaminase family protein [Pararobbsia silviterrae]RKP54778.1 transglutaminase family protein [Pararobbsia silviterrae]
MRLAIQHETTYRYESPVQYSIQQLRLTPANANAQLILHWHVEAPGKLDTSVDAYGNTLHTLVLTRPHREIRLRVSGEVDTMPLHDGRLGDVVGAVPLEHFTCATRLTEANEAIRSLAQETGALDRPAGLIELADRIRARVAYEPGTSDVASTAADALSAGKGVSQDHAHLMIACCRARGIPARYVSGYIDGGDTPQAASHAWVDVWLDKIGWISIDAARSEFAGGRYCRVAQGRDYEAAAPVRGTRIGGREERLQVSVRVNADTLQ